MEQEILNYHTLIFGNWMDDNNVKYNFSYITTAKGLEGKVIINNAVNSDTSNYSITKNGDKMYLTIDTTTYEVEELTEATLKSKGPAPVAKEFYLNKIPNETAISDKV